MARALKTLCESRARDHAVPTNMAYTCIFKICSSQTLRESPLVSKFYRPTTRYFPYVVDSKEKSTRYIGISTKETDLADRHDHRIGAKQIYYHTYL